MKVTESSESVLAGTKRPPFRLVVRAVHESGDRLDIRPAVSEEFVVKPCSQEIDSHHIHESVKAPSRMPLLISTLPAHSMCTSFFPAKLQSIWLILQKVCKRAVGRSLAHFSAAFSCPESSSLNLVAARAGSKSQLSSRVHRAGFYVLGGSFCQQSALRAGPVCRWSPNGRRTSRSRTSPAWMIPLQSSITWARKL